MEAHVNIKMDRAWTTVNSVRTANLVLKMAEYTNNGLKVQQALPFTVRLCDQGCFFINVFNCACYNWKHYDLERSNFAW